MRVNKIARQQKIKFINKVAIQNKEWGIPKSGWIALVREALGMSAAKLARRQKVTDAHMRFFEKSELKGTATINTMKKNAEAMNCKFVYAIVPNGSIEEIIEKQAYKKAKTLIEKVNVNMALEDQAITDGQSNARLKELVEELIANQPKDFWED